jgi:tRNA A64-2'-O-ribosylphosphate transferase
VRQDICKPNIAELRSKMQKPLRPIWVTHESTLPETIPEFPDFHPIVLCTASRRVRGAEASEGGYIQGAADDHEAWAGSLTPQLFWANKDRLLHTNEEDMSAVIDELAGQQTSAEAVATLIKPTSCLYVSSSEQVDLASFDAVISCTPEPMSHAALKEAGVTRYMHLKCQTGKLGSRDLRGQLPQLRVWRSEASEPGKVLVCCPTGKDLAVGTALAFLCLFVDDAGVVDMRKAREPRNVDKTFIKQRLSWITTSNPALNPSRATLQSVNTTLMSGEDVAKSNVGWSMVQQNPEGDDKRQSPTDADVADELSHLSTSEEAKSIPQALLGDDKAETPTASDPISTIFSRLVTPDEQSWKFTRTLRSVLASHPSGTVTGSAKFSRCSYAGAPPNTSTVLYSEEGEFVTNNGLRFTARRKYVYRLRVDANTKQGKNIAVFFFDDEKMPRGQSVYGVGENGEAIGGLFVETGELAIEGGAYTTKNREKHLCGEDLYSASWKFGDAMTEPTKGEEGRHQWWEVRYDVKGPKKDYTSETRYEKM